MATAAVFQYLGEIYSQPSLYNVSGYKGWVNTSREQNASLLPNNESTELISFQDDPSELPMSAAHFGLATGLLAILLNSRLFSFKVLKSDIRVSECQQWAEALLPRLLFSLLCLLLSAFLAPLAALLCLPLALYRRLVRTLLPLSNPGFDDLLDGTDAVWAVEDDASKSIINILAFFEVEIVDNVFRPQLLGMLRRLMRERILSRPDECPKFWQHRRRSRLGYFYWERQQEVRVEDHVQYMTQEDDLVNLEAFELLSEDCFRQEYYGMSESVLRGLVSELANSPLPYDNAASWEILVGRDPILEDPSADPFEAMEEGTPRLRRYPVLFRVHHSMGDGIALVRLLLETLADKNDPPAKKITPTQVLKCETTLCRLDSIDLIHCSTGSSEEQNHSKVKRPDFLDLSPTSLENTKKKLTAEFFGRDATSDSMEVLVGDSPNVLYTEPAESIAAPANCIGNEQVIGEVLSSLAEFLAQNTTNEGKEVFVDDFSNVLYTKPGESSNVLYKNQAESVDALTGCDDEEQVTGQVLSSNNNVDHVENYRQDLFCYPAKETVLMMDDSIHMANEIVLNPDANTIFFDNRAVGEDAYEKVLEYIPPPITETPHLFRDASPPLRRCKSPMPPFNRSASRIDRVMDEILESRCRSHVKVETSSTSSESSVAITLDEAEGIDSFFLEDPLPRVRTPYPAYEAMRVTRNESPVPKIHRKKYPVRFEDEDSDEDSLSPPRRGSSPSRSDSPFLRDNSPLPYTGKKGALRRRKDSSTSRSYTTVPRYNSSITSSSNIPIMRAESPFQINEMSVRGERDLVRRCHSPGIRNSQQLYKKNSPPRCYSPAIKNNFTMADEGLRSRCKSPVVRGKSPIPRNDNPIPRCNSPFMRNNSPIPRNDNPIPRCNSPFSRNNTPIPRNDNPIPRCNSPFMRNNTPIPTNENHIIPKSNSAFMRSNIPVLSNENPRSECNITPPLKSTKFSRPCSPFQEDNLTKQASVNQKYLTDNCDHQQVSGLRSKRRTDVTTVESRFNCLFVETADDTKEKPSADDPATFKQGEFTMQSVPLKLHSSPAYTEKFIRGQHFFSPDDEVINRSSVTPNCFIKLLDAINHRPSVIEYICNYVKNTCALALAPASLIHQTMMKAADVNPLHGPDLSGQKVVSWFFDSGSDNTDNLMSTIKRVKTRMSDAKFTDVFLSAVSASLESYMLRGGCESSSIPEAVTVVIPARMASESEISEAMAKREKETGQTSSDNFETEEKTSDHKPKIPAMENKFSVALLSLPITSISTDAKLVKPFSAISRLREICKHTDILRKSPDYYINYWLMQLVSKYLPVPLLAPLLNNNSTQSTMVVSNLFGPPKQLWLGGYHLKDIAFWVPNRGTTGVGISVLSYAGRLQIGIVADRALIPCQQDADIIIEGIISELKCLDEITAPVKAHPLKV